MSSVSISTSGRQSGAPPPRGRPPTFPRGRLLGGPVLLEAPYCVGCGKTSRLAVCQDCNHTGVTYGAIVLSPGGRCLHCGAISQMGGQP